MRNRQFLKQTKLNLDIGQYTLGISLSVKRKHTHNSFADTPPCGDIPTIPIIPTEHDWTCIHTHNVALVNPDRRTDRRMDGQTDAGRQVIRKAHLSFQLRWAKNKPARHPWPSQLSPPGVWRSPSWCGCSRVGHNLWLLCSPYLSSWNMRKSDF